MSNRSYKICIAMAKEQLKYDKPVVVFDVGCNINDIGSGHGFLDDFTAVAFEDFDKVKKVWAFEPVAWQRFEEVYKSNPKVVLTRKALDESVDSKEIYTPQAHGLSSFFLRGVFIKYDQYEKVEIKCDTLDVFVKANNINHIDYLKIDTEGAEFRVLKGAQEMLKAGKIAAIQLEHGETYADAGFTMEEINDFIVSFGFTKRYHNSTEMLYTL